MGQEEQQVFFFPFCFSSPWYFLNPYPRPPKVCSFFITEVVLNGSGGDFATQGTFGKIWRHSGLLHL